MRTGESRWEMPDHPYVPYKHKDSNGAPASPALNGAAGSATHCLASSPSPQLIQATGSKPNRHRNAVSRFQRWLWCFSILGIHLLVAQHVAADVPLVLMAGVIASVVSQALPISSMNAATRCSAAVAIFLLALRCRNHAEQTFRGLELTSSALGASEWRSVRRLEALFTSLLTTAVAASDGASVGSSARLATPKRLLPYAGRRANRPREPLSLSLSLSLPVLSGPGVSARAPMRGASGHVSWPCAHPGAGEAHTRDAQGHSRRTRMSGRVARPREALRTALRRRSISEISCAAADVEAALPAGSVLPAVTVLALNAAAAAACWRGSLRESARPGTAAVRRVSWTSRPRRASCVSRCRIRTKASGCGGRCASSPPAPCVAPTASRPTSRDDGSWALGERATATAAGARRACEVAASRNAAAVHSAEERDAHRQQTRHVNDANGLRRPRWPIERSVWISQSPSRPVSRIAAARAHARRGRVATAFERDAADA